MWSILYLCVIKRVLYSMWCQWTRCSVSLLVGLLLDAQWEGRIKPCTLKYIFDIYRKKLLASYGEKEPCLVTYYSVTSVLSGWCHIRAVQQSFHLIMWRASEILGFSWFKTRRLDLYINAQHLVIEFWLSLVIIWEWQPWLPSADLDVSKSSLSESFLPQLSQARSRGTTLTGAHLSSKKFVLFLSLERRIGPEWASLREVKGLLLLLSKSYLRGDRKEEEFTELNNWAGSE